MTRGRGVLRKCSRKTPRSSYSGKPVDIRRGEHGDYFVLGFAGERLAVIKVPRLLLKAAFATVGAARNEQRYAHADAVCDVAIFDFAVIHEFLR